MEFNGVYSVVDIVHAGLGIWGGDCYGALQDPELRELAAFLPVLLLDKWSDNTSRAYAGAFNRWRKWANQFQEVCLLPASPGYFCLYLVSLGQQEVSVSTINAAMAGINWAHQLAGLESPSSNITVKNTVEGLRRRLSRPRVVSEAIRPEHLLQMVQISSLIDLSDLRTLNIILLAFAGLLRFSEVSQIRTEHISLSETHLELVLPKAKNDQFRQGQTVYIARTGSAVCPVYMLSNYVRAAGLDLKVPEFIFRNLQHYKGGLRLSTIDSHMSYTRVAEIVQSKFVQIGLDKSKFKLHSLRAGGASAAANNHVDDRALQRHGRWKTGSVKNRYITESLSDLLSLSKNLGI
jgi:integrase